MMCGFCRAACPIFAVTGRERDNVRGKMQMANLVRTGELALSEEVARKFYLCTTCGACQSHCPAEIDVAGLVTTMRRQSFKSGYLPKEHQAMMAKRPTYREPLRSIPGKAVPAQRVPPRAEYCKW